MKKRAPVIFTALLFIIGIAVMLYPFFSNRYNRRNQAVIIENYDDTVGKIKEEKLKAERAAAQAYNESFLDNVVLTDPFDPEANKKTSEEYEARLNMNGDSIMGYIEIPKINVKLVIFHETSTDVLSKGVGHLENSSLPIGGTGTHAVLSAHTGYSKATFFNDLINLEEGDTFYLTVLDEKLVYQVDQIKVVEPSNTDDLRINRDKDYVTLVTCTPYGVNSHRLLVRGSRIPYVEDAELQIQADDWDMSYTTPSIIALIIMIIIITIFIIKRKQKRRREQ